MAVPWEMLVHPELLSNEQLVQVIQERHLRIPNLQTMPRVDLLDLFHNFCVPYGQRRHRDKNRAKISSKNRQISPEPSTKLNTNTSMSNTISSSANTRVPHSDNFERLKPPPDALAGHVKRIKLATFAVPITDNNVLKRKIAVACDNPTTNSPPQKKERKPITWP